MYVPCCTVTPCGESHTYSILSLFAVCLSVCLSVCQKAFNEMFAAAESENSLVYENFTFSGGYQRWGRNAGCDFFQRPPSMDTWGPEYFCTDNDERTCTPDHLMSGVSCPHGDRLSKFTRIANPRHPLSHDQCYDFCAGMLPS